MPSSQARLVASVLLLGPAVFAIPVSNPAHVLDSDPHHVLDGVLPADHKALRLSQAEAAGTIVKKKLQVADQETFIYEFEAPKIRADASECTTDVVDKFENVLQNKHCKTAFGARKDAKNIDMDVVCPCVMLIDAVEGIGMPDCYLPTPSGHSITIKQLDDACIEKDAAMVNFMAARALKKISIEENVTPPTASSTGASSLVAVSTSGEEIVLDQEAEGQLRLQQNTTGLVSYALSQTAEARSAPLATPLLLAASESRLATTTQTEPTSTDATHIHGFKGAVAPHYDPEVLFDVPAHGIMLQEQGQVPKWFTDLQAEAKAEVQSTAVALAGPGPAQLAVTARAKRNGKSIKSRIASKFFKQAYDPAMDHAAMQARNAWVATIPADATSTQCKAMYAELKVMKDHFAYFVDNPQEQIDDKGNYIVDQSDNLLDLEYKLHGFTGAAIILKTVLSIMGLLPYVGVAFKALGRGIGLVKTVLQNFLNRLRTFNNNFTKKIKPKVEVIVDKNVALAEKIETAKYMLVEYGINPTLVCDKVCEAVTTRTVCTPAAKNAIATANAEIQRVRNHIDWAVSLINVPYNMLKSVMHLIFTSAWNSFSNFMSGITGILQPFIDLIDVTICFPLPAVRWVSRCFWFPCGVSCGWGGCSVRWCHGCVPTPQPYFQNICFSVRQVLEGIAGAMSIVMNGLMSILKRMIPGLPSFSLPGVNFPTLPHIPNLHYLFHVDIMPVLNFPSLGFPCLPTHGFIAASNGALAVAAPSCSHWGSRGGCFAPPGVDFGACSLTCPVNGGRKALQLEAA